MNRLFICLMLALTASTARAEPVSFKGKTVTMIIGYPAGGGTDVAGRLVAASLGKFLPGEPSVVVQNVPGAEGLTAMNFFVQQVRPDGLTITMGSGSESDPNHYRKPLSRFDPTSFVFIGGAGRGGSALIINKDAERRLYEGSAVPVIMGTTSGAPRSNMQMAGWGKEFLGWNLKWVLGYRGTSELFVALDRGEIDMTVSSNLNLYQRLLDAGKSKILVQSGTIKDGKVVTRPDFGDAPLLPALIEGKIKDPIAAKGFEYWLMTHAGPDKWLALPPDTPDAIADAFRDAFARMVDDPEFNDRARKVADDFTPVFHRDVDQWMKALGRTPPEAMEFIATMMRGQGVKID